VTVLSWHTTTLMHSGSTATEAAFGGMQWAFGASAVLSVGILVLAWLLPKEAPEGAAAHH
jgi:hypothetical protein